VQAGLARRRAPAVGTANSSSLPVVLFAWRTERTPHCGAKMGETLWIRAFERLTEYVGCPRSSWFPYSNGPSQWQKARDAQS